MPNAEKVNKILLDCLFKDEEIINGKPVVDPILVEGLVKKFGFHPGRIMEHKDEIVEQLSDLPNQFYKDGGGGWSFLNFCQDNKGEQWGEHHKMEEVVVLGMAIGKVTYLVPRETWHRFPGGSSIYFN